MNVIVIMSDEHQARVTGHGGHPVVQTPNLDALAASSTVFDGAYTPSPICVPARASWATGRPVRDIAMWDNAMAYDGSTPGWGHALQQAGVRVESIGKLHYRRTEDPTGFDREILPMHIAGGIGQVWGSVRDPLPVRQHADLLVSWSGGGESDYTRYDRRICEAACRWITEAAGKGRPFVLYVGFVAPHFPYIAPEEFYELYDPADVPVAKLHPDTGAERHPWVEAHAGVLPDLDASNTPEERRRSTAAYWGLVSSLDANVGKILDALDATGTAEETLTIYTSDHGENLGARGLWGKSMLYEESSRIPLIVNGPGVPAGRICSTPTSLLDGYATITQAAGVAADERPGTRSWCDLAGEPDDPDRVVISEYHAFGSPSAGFLVRRGDVKLHHYVGFEPELFDLAADPEELVNLADDPAYAETRAELEAELAAVCDPAAVDRAAKADQAALIERFGGREAALAAGTVAQTPVPED